MPLHLLGKKSWNVYNPENVARVRRDEAEAKVREEEQERQMQEIDAERRIRILRGQRPPTPPPPPSPPSHATKPDKTDREETGKLRKRRRLAGENDTDRDIRFAREDAQFATAKREELTLSRIDDAPLQDDAGHINLFPSKRKNQPAEKNAEAEAESADQRRQHEDQYTMRFSNAAGFRQSVGQKPWYHSSSIGDAAAPESMPGKDVWGNEDPMRRQRELARMDVNDPLAVMKKGVRRLKSVEQERKKWNDDRNRELEELNAAEQSRSKHRRRRRSRSRSPASDASLEKFKLDTSPDRHRNDKDQKRSSHRHQHHYRDRSRDRSHRRHRSHSHRHHRDGYDARHDSTRRSRRS